MVDKGTTLVSRLLVDLETVFDEVSSTLGEKDDVATVPSDVTSVISIVKEIYNEVATIAQGTSLFAKSAPDTMEIDDSGTYSLELYDIGDAIPVSAEITAGNYQIDRVRNGALTNIVASTGASKGDGRIYASEDFTAAAGWAVGDIVLVTFSGGSILTGGVTTTLPNAYFYTRITRGESIETKVDTIITTLGGAETTGSYDLPNDTAENTLLEITGTDRLRLDAIWLDFNTLIQNVTIKVYHKIDGTTYRQYDEFSWFTSDEDGTFIAGVTINNDWKITVTSAVAQGAIKAIPYNIIKTTME